MSFPSRQSPARQGSRGFSLLEVVVALAILGMGVAAAVELYSMNLRYTKKSSDYSTALILARSGLDETLADAKGRLGVSSDEHPGGFVVLKEVSVIEKDGLKNYAVSVTVTYPPSGMLKLAGGRTQRE